MADRRNCKHRKNEDSKKCTKFDKLCAKKLCSKHIRTQTIIGNTASFENLSSASAQITNLVVDTINGVSSKCPSVINTSGVITPVVYDSSGPIQPANPGNFNQSVLNDLWTFTLLAGGVTNVEADSGRLRNAILNNFYNCTVCSSTDLSNCPCPNSTYAMFVGSITNNILTVTSMLPNTLTSCTPTTGVIQIGQMVFGQSETFLSSVIVSQLTGVSGGIGTYEIQNDFNDYSQLVPSQTMLSLSDLTTITCVNVPLRIYGVETISVTGTECQHIISAIAYNLNIANKTLETRIAAVYIQVGWRVPGTNVTEIQGIEIDTKQFDPSILSFGEQMNGNVLLPTDLISTISAYNTPNTVNAVVQLVVYVEDGAKVLIPSQSSSSGTLSKNASNVNDNVSRNFSASFTTGSLDRPTIIEADEFIPPGSVATVTVINGDCLGNNPLIECTAAIIPGNRPPSVSVPAQFVSITDNQKIRIYSYTTPTLYAGPGNIRIYNPNDPSCSSPIFDVDFIG